MPIVLMDGYPVMRQALHALLDDAAAEGLLDHPELGTDSWLVGAIARGITLALASPEWAQAALIEAGAPPALIAEKVVYQRAWIREHPIAVAR